MESGISSRMRAVDKRKYMLDLFDTASLTPPHNFFVGPRMPRFCLDRWRATLSLLDLLLTPVSFQSSTKHRRQHSKSSGKVFSDKVNCKGTLVSEDFKNIGCKKLDFTLHGDSLSWKWNAYWIFVKK